MPTFEGCIQAREISLCPIELGGGANPRAHALVLKSVASMAKTQPENTAMSTEPEKAAAAAAQTAAINKAALLQTTAIAAMTDVTKAHFLGLPDPDAQLAFLAKSADEQKTEAEVAKAAADKVALEAEAAKSGKTARELELEKGQDDLRAQIETLKAKQVQSDLEKRATTEFDGFPGGTVKAVERLKSIAGLPDADRVAIEDLMKAQALAAKANMLTYAGRTEEDITKAAAAKVKLDEAVKSYMAANPKVSETVAIEKVSEMPAFAAEVALVFGQ